MSPASLSSKDNLPRQFGLLTAVALIVGQVIAVGIFLTPAGMAKSLGSPFWLLAVWLLSGLMTLCGALCYGELAARFPEAGGSYVYLREIYGKPVAFLYGWMVLLVLDPGLTAIFGVGLMGYVDFLYPLSPVLKPILAIVTVWIIALLNILGVGIGTGVLKILTFLKVGTLLFIIAYGFLGGLGKWENFEPFFAVPPDLFGALAGGLVGAFFAFAGWWEVTRFAGEIRDPQRNVPKALTIGVLILTVIYILTSVVFMYLVPVALITNDETFAAQVGEALFGSVGGQIFSLIVIVSVIGSLVAYLMVSPRVYYTLAKDGLFFKPIARLHPRFKTLHRATIIQASLASILIMIGNFEQILSYFFFIVVFFIALSIGGLFRLERQNYKGYLTPFYPIPPIVFLILTGFVLLLIAVQNLVQTVLGIAVVLLGVPIYYLIFNRKRSAENGLDKHNFF